MRAKTRFYASVMPLLALLVSMFLFSCSKQNDAPAPNKADEQLESLIAYLEGQGFDREKIVQKGDLFIIDSDIVISKADLESRVADASKPETEHRRGPYLVSNTYNSNIRVYIDPAVPAAWVTATTGALANWNNITSTRLGFTRVTSASQADIRVFMGFENASWIARAYLPASNGRPGVSVEINSNYNSLPATQKLFAITHELGHNIGFYHTNQTTGTLIPGTPTTDANSVMNSFVLNWNGFTSADVNATRILYPQ
jgi:hypothetical protein